MRGGTDASGEDFVLRKMAGLTSVEVDQWLQGDLLRNVLLVLGRGKLLSRIVERVHIGVVVLGVVKLHDLAGDGRFEGAIVVCSIRLLAPRQLSAQIKVTTGDVHGRSGSVAFPRTKLAPARPARLEDVEEAARRAERAAEVLKRVADMIAQWCDVEVPKLAGGCTKEREAPSGRTRATPYYERATSWSEHLGSNRRFSPLSHETVTPTENGT